MNFSSPAACFPKLCGMYPPPLTPLFHVWCITIGTGVCIGELAVSPFIFIIVISNSDIIIALAWTISYRIFYQIRIIGLKKTHITTTFRSIFALAIFNIRSEIDWDVSFFQPKLAKLDKISIRDGKLFRLQ